MKKRIIAVLTSILIGTSICGAFPVQAEEINLNANYGTGLKFETPEEFAEKTGSTIRYCSSRTVTNLPSSVDLSTSAFFPPIDTQGNVGSCTAWSSTYYQFTYEVNKFKNEPTTSANIYSPAWTFNYINGGGEALYKLSDAYNVLKRHGAMKLVDFPCGTDVDTYEYSEWSSDIAKMTEALEYRADVYSLGTVDSDSISEIKAELASGKVAVVSTESGGWVIQENSNGEKFIVCGTTGKSHAIAVVGYDDNKQITVNSATLTGAFKLANSWGTDWGNDGYIWVSYDALNKTTSSTIPWEDSATKPLKYGANKEKTYSSSGRVPIFGAGNGFNFIKIYHCPVTFAGYVQYLTTDPYDITVYANEETAIANLAWDFSAGPVTYAQERIIVFDYFQFDTDDSAGKLFYEGSRYDMDSSLSSNWLVQLYDLSAPGTRRAKTKVIDNFGNVISAISDNYIALSDGKLTITTPVNLAKGRVTAYDNAAITHADSEMVQKYVIESIDLSNVQRYLADYNSDGAVNLLDVSNMNRDIAARNGETYAITDYIDEWGYSLADVIEEEYNMPVEQYVAENYAELSAINAIPAELELY